MVYVSINCYDHLSTGNIANDILTTVKSHGNICYLISINNRNNYEYSFRLYDGFFKHKISWVLSRIDGSDGFHNVGVTKKLIAFFEKIKPNVIHLHNLHGNWINLPILFDYLSKQNIKIIWTLHDCWPITGRCAHFDHNECLQWKSECLKCGYKKESFPRAYFFDRCNYFFNLKKKMISSIKEKCTIVVPSQWLYTIVKQSFLKDFELKVINNGVTLMFDRKSIKDDICKRYNLIGKKIILSMAYPFTDMKGIGFIKKIVSHFFNMKDDKVFVIIGLNKKQIKYFSKFTNCIPLPPIYNRNEILGWFDLADLFVNPTLQENFPTVTIESMILGTPPITFNSGGAAEALVNFKELIVEKNDLQGLIEKIDVIDKTMELSKKLKLESSKYTKELMLEKYFNIINKN